MYNAFQDGGKIFKIYQGSVETYCGHKMIGIELRYIILYFLP